MCVLFSYSDLFLFFYSLLLFDRFDSKHQVNLIERQRQQQKQQHVACSYIRFFPASAHAMPMPMLPTRMQYRCIIDSSARYWHFCFTATAGRKMIAKAGTLALTEDAYKCTNSAQRHTSRDYGVIERNHRANSSQRTN